MQRLEAETNTFFKLDTAGSVRKMRNPTDRIEGQELLPEEIEDTEEEIISRAQLGAFPEEYKALLTERETPKKSLLRQLCPWLDDQV